VLEPTLPEPIDILLVDDRIENLMTLETVLASTDYRLVRANSGDHALRYLLDHEPALILMDVQMPDLDGFETTAIIKRSERTRDIPIIFVTAINKDERYVQQGYEQGAIDYIYKPYDAGILRAKVAVFADLARKNRRLIAAERELRKSQIREREREITQLELKSLKREQVEQKRYLDLVQGISHGIVWSADADSMAISFVSPSAEKISGYPPEAWLQEPNFLLDHIFPEDRQKFSEAVTITKAERCDTTIEHRIVNSLGQAVWLHTQLKMARKAESSSHEIRGLSVDVTTMKESEETLRENKVRSDFLARASFILGENLNYQNSIERLAELVVPHCADGFAIHLMDATQCLRSLVVAGSIFEDLQMNDVMNEPQGRILTHHKGTVLLAPLIAHEKSFGVLTLIRTRKAPYCDSDLSMARDLALRVVVALENAGLHQMAQSAIRVRDDFLSVASHELKTPLTPLKLHTEILARLLRGDSPLEQKVEKVEKNLKNFDRQLDKLAVLIDELLDFSKMNNGKMSLNLETFDLVELAREVVGRFSEQLANAKCELHFDMIVVHPLMVHWDRFRIEQVMINLLTNAAKYAQGKPIHMAIWREDERVFFSVKDEGIGIAENDLDRIFDRFERAVSGKHFAGLGLGLYIVKQLLEAHGGEIKVVSQLHQGSSFTFSIPERAEVVALNVPAYDSNTLYLSGKYAIPRPTELKL
jgi:PAS domain S-box-containing protein